MENNRNNAYVQLPTSARLLAGFAGIIGKILRTLAVVLVALLVGEMGFIPGLLLGVVIGMVFSIKGLCEEEE